MREPVPFTHPVRYQGGPRDQWPASEVCDACQRAGRRALVLLPDDVAALGQAVQHPVRGPSRDPAMPRATHQERPLPIDVDADALRTLVVAECLAWAEIVDEHLEQADPHARLSDRWDTHSTRGLAPYLAVVRAVALIEPNWDLLVGIGPTGYPNPQRTGLYSRPAGPLLAKEVTEADPFLVIRDGPGAAVVFDELHHRVVAAVGLTDPPSRERGRCPWCMASGHLVRPAPAKAGDLAPVYCERCHRETPEETYGWWSDLTDTQKAHQAARAVARGRYPSRPADGPATSR
jgi:hypothetical protein